VLYLPAAIITVLLPRVAARTAGSQTSRDLLAKSVAVTASFCVALTVVYFFLGDQVVEVAFGSDYAAAGDLLWRFGVAMTGFAILNVLLVYHVGRGRNGVAWLLAAGCAAEIGAFALWHDDSRQLVNVDIVFAWVLVVVASVATLERGR
jgi:O-antigen/teichoic acid export membrane protein